ncbi:MAG: pyrroline-5-carboxylate reductase [Bosea sp. (in: a-proteobacteria)]
MSDLPRSLILIGAGKMGGAMLDGWLATGMNPRGVTILDPHPSPDASSTARAHGMQLNPPITHVPEAAAIVLAIKPQMLDAAAPLLKHLTKPGALIISILAGKTVADVSGRVNGHRAIVRAMPNLPASVRRGVTAACADAACTPGQIGMADALLKGIGKVEWISDESLIDAVTAVSGSGPAYVFHMVEALAEAGRAAGLPSDLAERLARATIEGAGELLHKSDIPPGVLRQNVTSPGGTTAAALEVLMADNGLTPLMRRTVAAAKRRAEELSG